MKKILFLTITAGFLIMGIQAEAAGWLSGWNYRKTLTFNNSGQNENLANFPVLVKLTTSNFDFSKAQSAGQDIRFTDSDGITLLKYEIEKWVVNTEAYIWVKVPQIDASSAVDSIYMYYGNGSVLDGQDKINVWDANFRAVWHLNSTAGNEPDSTVNGNNGIINGGITRGAAGKIGNAFSFDGIDDYASIANESNFDFERTNPFTISAWVKTSSVASQGIFGKMLANSPWTGYSFFIANTGFLYIQMYGTAAGNGINKRSNETFIDGNWHFVTMTYNGASNAAGAKLYKDGAENSYTVLSDTLSTSILNNDLPVFGEAASAGYKFNGLIDDVRVSNSVRSANWIKAQYLSENLSFITFGSQEAITFPLTVSKFGAGFGTVTSNPAGINCGADCAEDYNAGTVVTLTASSAGGSSFAGWSGACTGLGSCVLTMDAAKSVTAHFILTGSPGNVTGFAWSNMLAEGFSFSEEQIDSGNFAGLWSGGPTRIGQKKTISNKKVTSLGFFMYKSGSPSGNITFTVRRVSNDSIIVSKIWGDASALPTVPTWETVIFDTQPLIDEQVYFLFEWSGGGGDVDLRLSTSDVKANENLVGYAGSYSNNNTVDSTYKIGLIDPTLNQQGETIGWISFNSLNCDTDNNGFSNGGVGCPAAGTAMVQYGVTINSSNGTFVGYAWSEAIGWINFAPVGPYPATIPDTQYPACVDFPGNGQACDNIGNYNVGGWARAVSYGGGWDGWVHLRGVALDSSTYGVSINSSNGEFSGYAWSDAVIGWINFKGIDYKVQTTLDFNDPPNKPSTSEVNWNECSIRGGVAPVFGWTYSDPDGDLQSAYEIEVDDNSSFIAPKFNHLVNNSQSTSYTLNLSEDDDPPDPGGDWVSELTWNTTYNWHVRVKDTPGNWSEWSTPSQAKTPAQPSPWVEFAWSPSEPTKGETVEFIDQTETFGGTIIASWLWTIPATAGFVDGTTNATSSPHVQFSTAGINPVRLQVTDSSGFSCYTDKDVIIQLPLPEYQEISPVSWIKKIFTRLLAFLTNF